MFYEFNQNNSGGHFTRNSNVDHYVQIEANSIAEVIERAQEVGIYFNGCAEGLDCDCCGDRWYEPYNGDKLHDVPCHYDSPLTLENASTTKNPREHTVVIHYLDGRVVYTTSACENPSLRQWDDLALRTEDESEREF
jgi:hypothetical protein